MKLFRFDLLLVLTPFFALGESVVVSFPPPEGALKWINRPTTTWACRTGRNQATTFSIAKINTALRHALPLWGQENKETWAGRDFPQSVFTYTGGDSNGIQGWPDQSSGESGLHKLCMQRNWVGGYPILKVDQPDSPTRRTDSGQFRVLISDAYVDRQTEDGRVNEFAFCGLAVLLDPSEEDSYQMCWPTGQRSVKGAEDIVFA
ncbi:hypothetical protein FRC07_004841 [Ceratobasidium sp. 392]|nr:hypothetical protein FRC07_004841 [Ceratobasidium sp. 392]